MMVTLFLGIVSRHMHDKSLFQRYRNSELIKSKPAARQAGFVTVVFHVELEHLLTNYPVPRLSLG